MQLLPSDLWFDKDKLSDLKSDDRRTPKKFPDVKNFIVWDDLTSVDINFSVSTPDSFARAWRR